MLLSQKFTLSGRDPINGAKSGIYESFQPAEIAAAYVAGTGPGVATDVGTIALGTISPGHIVAMNANGDVELATSLVLGTVNPTLMFVVFSGDDDFSGATAGAVNCVHGGCRFDTEKYNTSQNFAPGVALIAVSGILNPKVATDHKQVVGFVGPRGVLNGVLDVIMPQGVSGY
jgi:hypothetical protein